MNGNGKPQIPFQAPAGTPLIGQAFTPLTVGVPMMMTLTCNCGPVEERATLLIHYLASLVRILVDKGLLTEADAFQALQYSAPCPHCRKVYSVFFNPQNGQTQMNVSPPPEPDQVPS